MCSLRQLGIQLGTVSFNAFFDNVLVGREYNLYHHLLHSNRPNLALSGTNLFLVAGEITKEHLNGRIVPQSGSNLDTIGVLFSNFLAGKNQTLSVQGSSVDPSGQGQMVSWLSTAFKTLTLKVTLPGEVFKVTNLFSCTCSRLSLICH